MQDVLIRPMEARDPEDCAKLIRDCLEQGTTRYKPLSPAELEAMLSREGAVGFTAADPAGKVLGFALGAEKTAFLRGQTRENTPLYLSMLLVSPSRQRQGIGSALLDAFRREGIRRGKPALHIGSDQPLHTAWLIPGTPGHDHNNAPGVWEEGGAVPWFEHRGFQTASREISLHIDLKDYRWDPSLDGKILRLREEGIAIGRWAPEMGREFDGMCDRVGSEYWRHVLETEIAAWDRNEPNADEDLWADGRRPSGPRPFLTAARDGHLIGFTGPVDRQASGRGWFTGICVDPLWGGRGIATVLFNMLLREFVQEDAAFCSIFTGIGNHAQKIYLRSGLRITSHWSAMNCPL